MPVTYICKYFDNFCALVPFHQGLTGSSDWLTFAVAEQYSEISK